MWGPDCPLLGCYANQGLAFGDMRVFECLAFNTAAVVIILAVMLQGPKAAELQGMCCRSGLRLFKRAADGWSIALNLTVQL